MLRAHRSRRGWAAALWLIGAQLAGCSLFNDLGDLQGGPPGSGGSATDGASDGVVSDVTGDGWASEDGDGAETSEDGASDVELDTASDATSDSPTDAVSDAALTYPQVVLQDSPVLYWRLGEAVGPTAADSSPLQQHPGTYVGTVTYAQPGAIAGDTDTAIALDGGWLEAGDVLDFAGTAAFTLEAWIRPSSVPNDYARIMTKDVLSPTRNGWALLMHDLPQPHLAFERWRDDNTEFANLDTTLSTSTFTHLAAVFDGSSVRVYLNGQSKAVAPSSQSLLDTTAILRVGAFNDTGANPFPGAIDEVAIYDHALPAARVLVHYQVGSGL